MTDVTAGLVAAGFSGSQARLDAVVLALRFGEFGSLEDLVGADRLHACVLCAGMCLIAARGMAG